MGPEIVVHATGDFHRLNSDISRTDSGLARLGRTAARGAAIGLGLAGAAVVKLGIDSVKAASASQQSIGATEAVFGRYADVVIDRSNEAANAVGLSANEYRELANVTGAMLQSAGTPLKQVTNLTDKLNVRAADMAATFGGTTAEAVQAVSALLRGETDPIERYGVAIKQTDINARLAAKGLDDLEGKALKQASQQERLALLFKQTGRAAGQFAEESDTLAGAQQRLSANFVDVKAKAGTILLPALTDLAVLGSKGLDELVEHGDDLKAMWAEIVDAVDPAVDAISEAFGHMIDDGDGLSDLFHDKLIPALEITSDAIAAVVGFVDGLPGPVKELGIEVGLAAIAFSVLSGWAGKASTALGKAGLTGATATAETRLKALKSAASTAAGVGGMLLLAKSTGETDDQLRGLEKTAGAALLGFSIGGPIGAAIGGSIALADSIANVKHELSIPERPWAAEIEATAQFAGTLDSVTGSVTEATRALALQKLQSTGAISIGNELGLTTRQLVDASLGNKAAQEAVGTAIHKQSGDMLLLDGRYAQLAGDLGIVENGMRSARRSIQNNAAATRDYGHTLDKLPKNVRQHIEATGIKPSVRGIANVLHGLKEIAPNLKNRDIKAIIEASGVDTTVKRVRAVEAGLKDVDRQKPKPKLDGDDKPLKNKVTESRRLLEDLHRRRAEPKADINLNAFYTARQNLISSLNSIPDEQVNIIVNRVGDGGGNGSGNGDPAGKRLFDDPLLADDGAFGVVERRVEKRGRDIIDRLIRGLLGGKDDVKSALGQITDLIEKRVNLKDDKAERAREKRILKGLKDEYAALTKIGKAQDRLNKKLEAAREHLQEVQEWVNTVRESFVETGNVTQLGVLGSGKVSSKLLLADLRKKLEEARRFAQLIRELTDDVGAQINDVTLQQLLAAGPAGGLATLEGLTLGGDAAINELNQLTGELGQLGDELGSDMSDQMFDVGLEAAQGIVAGLEAEDEALNRAARRLARKLANAVRHALAGLGRDHGNGNGNGREIADVMRGLTLGIDETAARTHGQRLASAMLAGFGTPRLGADFSSTGSAPTFTVKLTAEEASQLSRGKALTLDISAGAARGARQIAVR